MTATQTTIADQPRKSHARIISRLVGASRLSIARVGAASRRIATRGQLGPSVGRRDDLYPERYL